MEPIDLAKMHVTQYFNRKVEKTDVFSLSEDQVYVVWFCYILGGWKALLSTTVNDGMYYEVTYNREKRETYVDAYKKWDNLAISDDVIG